MPALHILSLALAVACLAGVNLYLTAFLAGLAGRMGWLPVEGDHAVIGILADPAIMSVALLLYLLEAVVDKVPGVDSLWDALHTVIRPAGAVMLALHIMGNADPAYQALAGVLAGLAGLTTHLAKSATRLLINNSPGPGMNVLVSLAEDVLVAGLFTLTVHQPLAGLIVCLSLTVLLWLLFPRMFRVARASLFLMWKKVRLPAGVMSERVKLPAKVSAEQDMLVHGELSGPCTVQWAVRCVTGRIRHFRKLKPNTFGTLVSVKEHPGALIFMGRRWFRHRPVTLWLADCETQHESGFLSENLVVYNKTEKQQIVFRFTRADEALAARLEEELQSQRKRSQSTAPIAQPPDAEEREMRRDTDDAVLYPLIHEAPFVSSVPVPGIPVFTPEPISPFPAAPGTAHVAPALTPLTGMPGAADVPPMPPLSPVTPTDDR